MTYSHLVETLAAAGKPARTVQCPDGTRVLLLPYGGRVLGLFAPGDDENFYWTHPALASVESARAFYSSGEWQNSGGDRTWLAPEVDIFFPRYPDLDPSTYWQPRELDPGDYQVDSSGGIVKLTNRLSLTFSRSGRRVDLEMAKWVMPAANPLRYEAALADLTVGYAGYTQHTTLALTGAEARPVGLWNLVQMPHGGELLIPTYSKAEPKIYMGSIPDGDLVVSSQLVRYRMRAAGEQKIGIRAVITTGRAGYCYPSRGGLALVVRNFSVNPSGEYVDVPWREPNDLGYSTQACNVNGRWGQFSELEYHVPAIGTGAGDSRCEDISQVWAFRGASADILRIARRLLSPEV